MPQILSGGRYSETNPGYEKMLLPCEAEYGLPCPRALCVSCAQTIWDNPTSRAAFNSDVRLNLGAVKYWTSADYLQVGGL